jgi:hypothetical protein
VRPCNGARTDNASLTGWGRLDDLLALAEGLGVLRALNGIHPKLTWEGSVPRWCIHQALFLRTRVRGRGGEYQATRHRGPPAQAAAMPKRWGKG